MRGSALRVVRAAMSLVLLAVAASACAKNAGTPDDASTPPPASEAQPELEQPLADPLAGSWSWTGAREANGSIGPTEDARTYTILATPEGYVLASGETTICPVTFDGISVSFTATLEVAAPGTFTGTLSGDQIGGTQSYGDRWQGPWNATRVR